MLMIGKVIKKENKYVSQIVNNNGEEKDQVYTISNKCINFSQFEKVDYKGQRRTIMSSLPYEKEGEFYVKLDGNEEVNINELPKRKIDILDGQFCYFTFMKGYDKLLEYRGHCPKSLYPILLEYFQENQKYQNKITLSSLIYGNEKVNQRRLALGNRVSEQSVQNN